MTNDKKILEEQLQLLSEKTQETGFLDPMQYLCSKAKEIYQTDDSFEAVRLIRTEKWAISTGFVRNDKVNWILLRYA